MALSSKPKLLTKKSKSPLLKGMVSSASKSNSPLLPKKTKGHSKTNVPEQAFAIPGFGMTGLTGES